MPWSVILLPLCVDDSLPANTYGAMEYVTTTYTDASVPAACCRVVTPYLAVERFTVKIKFTPFGCLLGLCWYKVKFGTCTFNLRDE
jgi:hypothetical protein